MKRLLFCIFILFGSCLFANDSDSLLIDGRYQKITLKKKNLPQEMVQNIWNTYLKDMDFFFIFESPEIKGENIVQMYCSRKYLKDYGISRLDYDERGNYQIQEYVLSYYSKLYFNLDDKTQSLKNLNTHAWIGKNYLNDEMPAYHLTHIDQYSQDIVKAYLHRYNEKTKAHKIYAAYLKKRKDSTYYFMCVREIYDAEKALVKKSNPLTVDLKNNCIEFYDSDYIGKYSDYYFVKEINNSLYFIGQYYKDQKRYKGIFKYNKETLKLQKQVKFPFGINSFYGWRSSYDNQNIHLTYNGYNLICQTDKDSLIIVQRPHHVTHKTVNSAKQTFVNYFNDVSTDNSKAVYVDYEGVILYDMANNQEIVIKKMDNNVAWLHSPQFIENDQKVIFFENGDEYTGPVYIYDIASNKLVTTDLPTESSYFMTSQGVVSTFTDYDKSYIKIVSFNSSHTIIPVEDTIEQYPQVKFNENYFAFIAGNSLYALNLKTLKVSQALATNHRGSIKPIAVTKDNRILFETRDLEYNCRLFMTKPGVLK